MVIDEGIDTAAAEVRGKVLASFAIQCPDSPDGDAETGSGGADAGAPPATFEERKQAYLAQLAAPDPSCHFVPAAIAAKSDPLAAIAPIAIGGTGWCGRRSTRTRCSATANG